VDAPAKKPTEKPPEVLLLERILAAARAGKVRHVVIAYTNEAGADGVQASPMNVITMNHLWRLFDERVRGAYREVRVRERGSRSPTAAMSVTAPKALAAELPRAVRRAVAKAQLKAASKGQRLPPPKPAATN